MIKQSVLSICFLLILLVNTVLPVRASNSIISSIPITPVPTIEYNLPYPGILPDNPLYSLKTLRDKILIFFTSDGIKKAQLNLLLSDKRLMMGEILWEKGNTELSISTITKAEKYLLNTSLELVALKKQDKLPPGLADKVALAAKKHIEVIEKIISKTNNETVVNRLKDALGVTNQAIAQIAITK